MRKEQDMPCEEIEMVLELPEPMERWKAEGWESINRPPKCLWLEEFEPIGEEPALKWRAVYEVCDEDTAGLCS